MSIIQVEQELREIKDYMTMQSILQKEIFTLKEAAIYLGISTSYLYKLTSARAIPFYKPAAKLNFFRKRELNDWLLKNRHATISELSVVPLQKTKQLIV